MIRKRSRVYTLIFVLLCCGLFAEYYYLKVMRKDTQPPKITVPAEILTTTVAARNDVLLEGITAKDGKDGDVTKSLLVERISSYAGEKGCVEVTVAAFDAAGNVAKAGRIVRFEDYVSPRFTLSGPLRFWVQDKIDVFSLIGAADMIDGTLNDRVKASLIEGGTSISQTGVYQVEFRVTNNIGDTVYLTLPVEVYGGSADSFVPELDQYLIYLKTGDKLKPMDHLKSIGIGKQRYPLDQLPEGMRVEVESDLDTSEPGVYQITYCVTMNQYSGSTCLLVVVEE